MRLEYDPHTVNRYALYSEVTNSEFKKIPDYIIHLSHHVSVLWRTTRRRQCEPFHPHKDQEEVTIYSDTNHNEVS